MSTATDGIAPVPIDGQHLLQLCTAPQLIAHLRVPYGVKGLEQGAPVTICRLKLRVSRAWGRLRNFS